MAHKSQVWVVDDDDAYARAQILNEKDDGTTIVLVVLVIRPTQSERHRAHSEGRALAETARVSAAPCFSRMRAIRPRGAIADFLQVHFNGEAKGQQHTDVIGRQWIYLRTPRMKPERPEGTVALSARLRTTEPPRC
jgi:hypothetical protein